jgi:hypothetical protein
VSWEDRGVGHGRGTSPTFLCTDATALSLARVEVVGLTPSASGTRPIHEQTVSGCKDWNDENRGPSSGEGLARTSADKHRRSNIDG